MIPTTLRTKATVNISHNLGMHEQGLAKMLMLSKGEYMVATHLNPFDGYLANATG